MFRRQKKTLLTCPSCGHKQEEAVFALSTFCRGCGAHYKIEDRVAVAAAPAPEFPFSTRTSLEKGKRSVPRKKEVIRKPKVSAPKKDETDPGKARQLEFSALGRSTPDAKQSARKDGSEAPARKAPRRAAMATSKLVATPSGDHPTLARLARSLPRIPKEGHRHVNCIECDYPQSIPIGAISAMCLRCSESIPLDDYDIREMHHHRIRTRGNVHVHRKGGLNGVSVKCNDLTIEGEFKGCGVDCNGDFTITRNGVISGPVKCHRLVISGRAEVEFTSPVYADEVVIDGIVKGNITCDGKLELEKMALLEGDVQIRSLSIKEGARHNGMVSMPQFEEKYAEFAEDIIPSVTDKSEEQALEENNRLAARSKPGRVAEVS